MKYEKYFKDHLTSIEKTLNELLPEASQTPGEVHEAMRYAVFPAGKRFRAVLALAGCEASGGNREDALISAAAVELIHSYSLVHDDLPALDNDDLRRGQPSCHKRYGEAIAILAGDGLLTLAFNVLTRIPNPALALSVISELSTSAGTYGMIGGQVADLGASPDSLSLLMMDYINVHKTGKLIKAAVVCGGLSAGASEETLRHLTRYGECIGLAFQSVDDLDDGDGYLKLLKAREVRMKVRDLIAQAKRETRPLGKNADALNFLADVLLSRIPRGNHAKMDS